MKALVTEKQIGLLRKYMKTFINESSDFKKNPSHDQMRENVVYFLKTLGFFKTDTYGLTDLNNDGIKDTEMFSFEKNGIKVFIGVTSRIDNENVFYTVFIRLNDNEYPLRPTIFNTTRELENTLTNILRDLEDKNKLVDLGIKEPGEPKPYNKSNMSTELVNQTKDYMSKFVNENKKNMRLVITETQLKRLQKHIKNEELKEASLGKKLGMGALGAGLALGSAKGQDIEPKGKWDFSSPYSKEKITVDTNSINFKDAGQVEDIMEIIFNQVKFMDTTIQLDIDYNSVERLRNLVNNRDMGQRPDLKNQMIGDIITPEVINDLRNQFSQMIIDSSRYGGKNVRGVFQVPKGYEGQQEGFKLFVQALKGIFGSSVVIPIRNVRMSDDVLRKFLYALLAGKNSSSIDVSRGPRNTTLIQGY
jgi:hypothetical protein